MLPPKHILNAISSLSSKLRDRLADKKDLTLIRSALIELAGYLYTEIPEISEATEAAQHDLERYGMVSLLRFADSINSLPPYKSEPTLMTVHEDVSRRVALTGSKISRLLIHENILVAFAAWYLLTFCIISGGFYLAFRLTGMKLDSVSLAAIVGGPVASAITAVTIPRLRQQKDQN